MGDVMKKPYLVVSGPIRHGDEGGTLKDYAEGEPIELTNEQAAQLGKAVRPIGEHETLALENYQPGGIITLTEDQAVALNLAIDDEIIEFSELGEIGDYAAGDELKLTEAHIKVLADAAKGASDKGGGPTYVQDMTITLMPSEAKILAKHLGPGVEGRMYQRGEVIALTHAEATLLETQGTSGMKNARKKKNQEG